MNPGPSTKARLRMGVRGVVQGVGFRPFVYRLAARFELAGWVSNGRQGVTVEVEGAREAVETFPECMVAEAPRHSRIRLVERSWLEPRGDVGFRIRGSDEESNGESVTMVVPDLATCDECRDEIFDPANRRFRYPFTNCTLCGPRYSIVAALPYDRVRTSMREFRMCRRCQAEFEDPGERRFHAQPIACPECGPQLTFRRLSGGVATRDAALHAAAAALRSGQVVVVKGIGGFHLWTPAHDETAVARLRARKHRESKPLALMFPSMDAVRHVCEVSRLEEKLLQSPEAPIVLLRRRVDSASEGKSWVAESVAPGNPYLGVMLPNAPLHHLLLAELGCAVVATSGNRGDEPICFEDEEVMGRLHAIADGFLIHDRPILRPVDDSIVREVDGRPLILRLARGYAPSALRLTGDWRRVGEEGSVRRRVLGVGGHMKCAVAILDGEEVIVGQHLGDLETPHGWAAYRRGVGDLQQLFEYRPSRVAADGHPDYGSTQFARELGLPVVSVQHHHAHVLGCLAENEAALPALGVAWDGTGDGMDGTIWGGEFLRVTASGIDRFAWLRPFRLPGGEAGVREPRRSALGLLHQMLGTEMIRRRDLAPIRGLSEGKLSLLESMLTRGVRSPLTSSVGRLFDGMASLLGLRQISGFEGDAAMAVEFAAEGVGSQESYEFPLVPRDGSVGASTAYEADWTPMLRGVLEDLGRGVGVPEIAARFQDTLAGVIVSVASLAGEERVALSGGCFQNRRLTEETLRRLRRAGFQPICHQRFPPNDGGLALGQVVAALRAKE